MPIINNKVSPKLSVCGVLFQHYFVMGIGPINGMCFSGNRCEII